MKTDRNISVELMRICMMFGIVLLHIITQTSSFSDTGLLVRKFTNILSPCVVGFVFISGYFGIRFRCSKGLKLLGLALLWAVVFSGPYGWKTAYEYATHNWFLYGYFVLMLMAPALNAAFEGKSPRDVIKIGAPILFAVYGWSYLCVIPGVKAYVPTNLGFAPLSFFTMIGIYVAARMYRILGLEQQIRVGFAVGVGVLSLGFVAVGMYHHNSPLSLVLVACVFTLVKRVTVGGMMSKVIAQIAPSMFSVYLIHASSTGRVFFRWLQQVLIQCGFNPLAASVMDALVVVVLCVLCDFVRQGIGAVCGLIIGRFVSGGWTDAK